MLRYVIIELSQRIVAISPVRLESDRRPVAETPDRRQSITGEGSCRTSGQSQVILARKLASAGIASTALLC
jgi:hypothetical protein